MILQQEVVSIQSLKMRRSSLKLLQHMANGLHFMLGFL